MDRSTIDTHEVRVSCGRPPVNLASPDAVAQWLAEARAAVSVLTHAARDACSRDRMFSRTELRRRVRRADRLVRALLSEASEAAPRHPGEADGDRHASLPPPPSASPQGGEGDER